MYNLKRSIIFYLSKNRLTWFIAQLLLKYPHKLFEAILFYRNDEHLKYTLKKETKEIIAEVLDKLIVASGPFKGLKYSSLDSYGSSLLPKLLGTYERELSEVINVICNKKYSSIVDIGCAEGYYANGFAKKMQIPVFAFDISSTARNLCKELSVINKTNLKIGGFCDLNTLCSLDLGKKSLIMMDCEGYELNLLDNNFVKKLGSHDLLIELHNNVNIEISQKVIGILSETHLIQEINSVDDIQKAYTYKIKEIPELDFVSLNEKLKCFAEYRSSIMTWIYATTKS